MRLSVRVILFFLIIVWSGVGFSVPFAFTYAGRLLDGSGNPLSGSQSVQITFWTAQTGGSQLAANLQSGTTNDTYTVNVVNGVFSQVINLSAANFHTVFPDSTTGTWVQVEAAGITYPRQQFTAVPYALKVPVDGTTITYNSSGQLQVSSIGSVANLTAATTLSTTSAGSAAAPALFFGGDTNTGIYSSGADSLSMSTNGQARLTIDASGNVGIGTTNPTAQLEVGGNGSARFGNFRWYSGTAATQNAVYGAGVSGGFAVTLNDEQGTQLTAGNVYRIRVITIGTATPNGALYLVYYNFSNSAWIAHFVSRNGSSSNHPLLAISGSQAIAYTNHSSSYSILYTVETITTGLGRFDVSAMGADWGWQRDGGAITYLDGNVGIGTSTPTSKLQVDGVIGTSSGSAAAPAIVPTTDKNTGLLFPAADTVAISTGGTERMRITSDGRLGIGYTGSGNHAFGIQNATSGAGEHIGVVAAPRFSSSATVLNNFWSEPYSDGTLNTIRNLRILPHAGNGTVENSHGILISPTFTKGTVTNYGVISSIPSSAAGAYNLYINGTAPNLFAGQVLTTNGTAAAPAISIHGDANTGMFSPSADSIGISTGGTERMRINSAGRVGMGIDAPLTQLHMVGEADIIQELAPSASSTLLMTEHREGATRFGGIYTYGSTYSGGSAFNVGSGGMALVGNTSKLAVGTMSAEPLILGTGNSEKVRVESSGNVGIGITSPAAKLDVAGEVKFGNTSSTCNATNEGQQRYNSTSKNMEFCNGTAWTAYGTGTSVPSGEQLFLASGTFTIPAGVTTVRVEVWGGGGGGSCTKAAGGAGGTSSFGSYLSASGGGGASTSSNTYAYGGGGGSGSGGSVNLTGGKGEGVTDVSGQGGGSPFGGAGGTQGCWGCSYNVAGAPGVIPGGGGGGAYWPSNSWGAGGGGGGYAYEEVSSLTPGSTISVTVGGGGGPSNGTCSGSGAQGAVRVRW